MAPDEDFSKEPDAPPPQMIPGGTPQAATKRWPWSRPKVQHKPTRKNKKDFAKLVQRGEYVQ